MSYYGSRQFEPIKFYVHLRDSSSKYPLCSLPHPKVGTRGYKFNYITVLDETKANCPDCFNLVAQLLIDTHEEPK